MDVSRVSKLVDVDALRNVPAKFTIRGGEGDLHAVRKTSSLLHLVRAALIDGRHFQHHYGRSSLVGMRSRSSELFAEEGDITKLKGPCAVSVECRLVMKRGSYSAYGEHLTHSCRTKLTC